MTTFEAAPPLDDQICFSLYGASMAVGRLYKPLLDRLGLTYPQYLVLSALWEKDKRNIGEIAERLMLESSTITPLVKRLAAAGFVVRARNPENERQVIVTLTPTGEAMAKECACLGERLLARSGQELAQLHRLNGEIQALRDSLAGAVERA